jgi:aspartyl-tRNA(Asn)/glutamyl-tRNA(Gln) amidotransferase subunit B
MREDKKMEWEVVIGLEVHVQLSTATKLFSGASTTFGAEPNTQACAIDLALPGVLPVFNEKALALAVRFGVSVDAEIAERSVFARKNYFYPDLPKGYQISQFEAPIVGPGHLDIVLDSGELKRIRITRAHLEEDAGKSIHDAIPGQSGIDLNRAGTPLLEIVSEPDLRSASEAVSYLKTLHRLVRCIGISDANMQEGSFRCDVNISLRPMGSEVLGTRSEIKNVNSFRFVEKAIFYEVERQKRLLTQGDSVVQETRQYDAAAGITRAMRQKEEAHDYRYFPDPDLLPVVIDAAFIADIKANLPELPHQMRARFEAIDGLGVADAAFLSSDDALAAYFESALSHVKHATPKLLANWMQADVAAYLNKAHVGIAALPLPAEQLATLVDRIADQTISNTMAKTIFERLCAKGGSVDGVIDSEGLRQISDEGTLKTMVDEIIAAHPGQLAQYRAGKTKLFGFFVGQMMKKTQGKANPAQINALLTDRLSGE